MFLIIVVIIKIGVEMKSNDNPFYDNHVFSKFDLDKITIKWWEYPLLIFLPTYIQINGDYEFHFKNWSGRYFLMKIIKRKIIDIDNDTYCKNFLSYFQKKKMVDIIKGF